MSSATLQAAKNRLCPMCGFEPCRRTECMFFAPYNSQDSECIFLQTYFLSNSAYANTAWANLTSRSDPFITAMTLRPEVLKDKVDATDRAIEALEAIQGYPCNLSETEFGIAHILNTLKAHKAHLMSASARGDDLSRPRRKKKN